MLILYTNQITSRLQYIVDYIFSQQLGLLYHITSNKKEFETASQLIKLNYSNDTFLFECMQLQPHQLLFEEQIVNQILETVTLKNQTYLFPTKGFLPFDIFAACFFCITRYEEYLPHTQNQFGQFQAKESWSYKNYVLHQPIVDIWIIALKQKIRENFPTINFLQQQFTYQFTYDIDTAYYYAGKPFFKNIGLLAKNLITLNFSEFTKRIEAIINSEKDIANTYDYIIDKNKVVKPILFFLVGDNQHIRNPNLPHQNKLMLQLINKLKHKVIVGLHPSYETPRNKKMIADEKSRLAHLLNSTVNISRQHYLRYYMPTTYNHLIDCGITDDYTMAYAEQPGFRAGTCKPFKFFDVVENQEKNLKIHPITFMEGTYAEDLNMHPKDAEIEMFKLIDAVKNVQGQFICIWHNHSLSNYGFWKGWRIVHDNLVDYVIT